MRDLIEKNNNVGIEGNLYSNIFIIIFYISDAMTMGEDFTTNISCGGISSGTEISSDDEIKDVVKDMVYKEPPETPVDPPTPSSTYESKSLGTWASLSDVDAFYVDHNPENGWAGLNLGNYVTIQDGTYNVDWEIAGFNLEHNQSAFDGTIYDNGYGICWIPKSIVREDEDEDIPYYQNIWAYNVCYRDSYIHHYANHQLYNALKTVCGSHIVKRNVCLVSKQIDAIYSSGRPTTAAEWEEAYLTSMSSYQLVGRGSTSFIYHNDGEAHYRLPLFDYEDYIDTNASYWLRDVFGCLDDGSTGALGTYNMYNVLSSGHSSDPGIKRKETQDMHIGSSAVSDIGIRPMMYMR